MWHTAYPLSQILTEFCLLQPVEQRMAIAVTSTSVFCIGFRPRPFNNSKVSNFQTHKHLIVVELFLKSMFSQRDTMLSLTMHDHVASTFRYFHSKKRSKLLEAPMTIGSKPRLLLFIGERQAKTERKRANRNCIKIFCKSVMFLEN